MGKEVTDYHDFTTVDTPKRERARMNVGDVFINEILCLNCADIIRSKNRHDFKWCECGAVAVDGGSWYLKRAGDLKGYSEQSLMFSDVEVKE